MRRFAFLLSLAFVFAALASAINDPWPSGDGIKVASASGCGDNGTWHQIGYTAAGNTDPLGQNASTDITLWQDGCGNAQARLSVWSRTWSALSQVGVGGRIWVCGGSGGGNPSTIFHIFSSVYWSGWFNASGCGIGVDDAWPGGQGTKACTSAACYDANNFGVFYDHL